MYIRYIQNYHGHYSFTSQKGEIELNKLCTNDKLVVLRNQL